MRHNRIKDFNLRNKLKNTEFNTFLFKSILNNENIDLNLRFKYTLMFSNYIKNNFKTKINNKCIISHRNNSVLRDFKVERSCFNEFAKDGLVSGFKKSTW